MVVINALGNLERDDPLSRIVFDRAGSRINVNEFRFFVFVLFFVQSCWRSADQTEHSPFALVVARWKRGQSAPIVPSFNVRFTTRPAHEQRKGSWSVAGCVSSHFSCEHPAPSFRRIRRKFYQCSLNRSRGNMVTGWKKRKPTPMSWHCENRDINKRNQRSFGQFLIHASEYDPSQVFEQHQAARLVMQRCGNLTDLGQSRKSS